jgi:NAD(P)-dependent dehydrogenase (short-subunit alcohol dehydrogenase family)
MKSVLVTGASGGIGHETARQLLRLGWRVFVHARSQQQAERSASELMHAADCGAVEAVWGDLSDMREVIALAQQVADKTTSLDVLINNAGVYERQPWRSCARTCTRRSMSRTRA